MVGGILLVSALIFGALASGVLVQRLHATPAASSQQERGGEVNDQSQGNAPNTTPNRGQPESPEPDDQDKDT
jgi:hypothetical protein